MQPLEGKSGYIASLDGWRALAIAGVLVAHDTPWHWNGTSLGAWQAVGGGGVGLFFALSGFLIASRILDEEHERGLFRLKAFFTRRILRIQPALLVYLAVIALLARVRVLPETWHYLAGALFLYRNFEQSYTFSYGGVFTGHCWTLAVEEHFYLVLSLFLFFVRRHRVRNFIALLLALFVLRTVLLYHQSIFPPLATHSYVVLQLLMIPALFAILLRGSIARDIAVSYLHPWTAFVLTGLACIVDWFCHQQGHPHGTAVSALASEERVVSYGFALWVVATAFHPHSYTTRLLEFRCFRWLGRISYSLYLWHALFFFDAETRMPRLLHHRAWKYAATAACALVSYYLVERPCIRLGHRLAPPATPGHRDLDTTWHTPTL